MSEQATISPQQTTQSATPEASPATECPEGEIYREGLSRLPIQRKLSMGAADDPAEQEADAMATRVMRMPETPFLPVQRKEDPNGAEVHEPLANRIQSSRGEGSPLAAPTRSFMESRFGADFSSVRVHHDQDAARLSGELSAQAFTVGSDIYFNQGKYSPETDTGKELLAHELTHTIQQGQAAPKVQARLSAGPAFEDGLAPVISDAGSIDSLIADGLSFLSGHSHNPYRAILIFTQNGLAVYDLTSRRITHRYQQRTGEPMFPEGMWSMETSGAILRAGFRDRQLIAEARTLEVTNFTTARRAQITQRGGNILLTDFINMEEGELARINALPALSLSRELPAGNGSGNGQPEAWASDQVRTLHQRQRSGAQSGDTTPSERNTAADQRIPDRTVLWVRPADGAQFVNVWVGQQHQALQLQEGETPEQLQQRVEQATQQMREQQTSQAVTEEQRVTGGNIPYNDSTYTGGTNGEGPRPNRPAFRADITGPETMVREGTGNYRMSLHYEDEDPTLLGQVLEAYSGASYIWQIIDITALYQQIMRDRAAQVQARQEQLRQGITPTPDQPTSGQQQLDTITHRDAASAHTTVGVTDAVGRDAVRRYRNFREDYEQAQYDLTHPLESQDGSSEAAIRSVLVNTFNLATSDLHAILTAGGWLVQAFAAIFQPHDQYEREIPFPDRDGYYLVRGIAQPRQRGDDDHPIVRVPSVAVKVVHVQEIRERTREELNAQDQNLQASIQELLLSYRLVRDVTQLRGIREALELKVQEAAQSNRSFLEEQVRLLTEQTHAPNIQPDLLQRLQEEIQILQQGTRQGSGLVSDIISRQITLKERELEAARASGNIYDVRRIEGELDQLRSRLSTATAREREMQGGNQPIVRPQAVFVNEEDGRTIPLLIELGQVDERSIIRGYTMRLSDVAGTDSDQYDAIGRTRAEAVRHVINEYAGHFPYGRGYMTVRIPAGSDFGITEPILVRCNPRDTAQASERLDELLQVLAIVGLAVPGVGTAVAAIGAAVAAARILHRISNHTFEWDANTVMDVLNIVGAVAGGVSHIAESRLVVARNMFAVVPESEDIGAWVTRLERFVRIVDFVDESVNQVSYMLGTMQTVNEYLDIQREELSGGISHAEARRRRAQLMTHAMYDQFMQHAPGVVGHFRGDGTPVHPGEERAPLAPGEERRLPGDEGRTPPVRDEQGGPTGDEHQPTAGGTGHTGERTGAPEGHPHQLTLGDLLGSAPGVDRIGHVPVTRPEGLTGNETRARFENGRVILELGPQAGASQIRQHLETVRVLQRYEGALGYVRQLLSRVGELFGFGPGFGSRGFEARREVEKLVGIRSELEALRDMVETAMIHVNTIPELEALARDNSSLRTEIEAINNQIEWHAREINSTAPGMGYVAMASTTPPLTEASARFGVDPNIGESVRYRDRGGTEGIATRLSSDTLAIVTRLGQSTVRADYQSRLTPGQVNLPSGRHGFEALHAIGPGVGHESPYGIYFGPWRVNQLIQRVGIERFIGNVGEHIRPGQQVLLRVTVEKETLPVVQRDGTILQVDFLKSITYQIYGDSVRPGNKLFELSIGVTEPNNPVSDVIFDHDSVFTSPRLDHYTDMSRVAESFEPEFHATDPRDEP